MTTTAVKPSPRLRPPKASDISDAEMLAAIRACRGRHGVPQWAVSWEVYDHLSAYPWKVVRAKVAGMIRRGLMDGCTCGCRGDYEIMGETFEERRKEARP